MIIAVGQFLAGKGIDELNRVFKAYDREKVIDRAIGQATAQHGRYHSLSNINMLCDTCAGIGWTRRAHKQNHKKKKKTKYCRYCNKSDWPYSAFPK
ncbi:hypothetical protein [Streptomyces sp. NPDC088360]|uniref:hypothetical protein n=1 Tax=unclassified Streptomyces TaxID=2593676 RepID=UPI00344C1D94